MEKKIVERGFTLVELLIVISIISILAVIGTVVFQGITKGARDSRRKADISAISKAYEVKYQTTGSYQAVSDADFSQGKKPTDPLGGDYYNNRATDNSAYRVCAALENNPQRTCSAPSTNCYCASSAQGSYQAGSGGNGIPPDHPVSCDPNGSLSWGLVGYWKMDDSGTIAVDSSGKGYNGTYMNGAAVVTGQSGFGSAASFDGINDYIDAGNGSNYPDLTLGTNPFTLSAWIFLDSIAGASIFSNTRSGGYTGFEVTAAGTVRFAGGESFSTVGMETNFAGGTINISNWYNIAITREPVGASNQIMKIYLQGNKVAENNDSLRNMGGNGVYNLFFGEFRDGIRQLYGKLDDVRVYNRALSALEITALYNSGNGCIPP